MSSIVNDSSDNLPFFQELRNKLKNYTKVSIVLPEGNDSRIIEAANKLVKNDVLTPVLLGNPKEIYEIAEQMDIDASQFSIIDPKNSDYIGKMIPIFLEKRRGKIDETQVTTVLQDVNYFGTMLVEMDIAQGLVSGAVHTTAETVRPGLQIIKTKAGSGKISGSFILIKDEKKYIFADCAININPSAEDLADIAIQSEKTARSFNMDPRVAMLSFSSHGSAKSEETEKVRRATEIVKEKNPDLVIDGELQFDSAVVPEVSMKKVPDSILKGSANVLVFPTIDAGNIGYKIAQRFGGFSAIGPILQGLAKPVNDLSRGCIAEDVYRLAIISAVQSVLLLDSK